MLDNICNEQGAFSGPFLHHFEILLCFVHENGVRVPEDIAVCGFDNTRLAVEKGVTTVDIPNYERGYLAAQALVEMIEGGNNYEPFLISTNVKWRSSTKRP